MTGSPFDPVHVAWAGKQYTIAADRVMGAIKRVEDHVTLAELQVAASRGQLKLARLAGAYADLLRYAGAADVTEADVYAGMFGADAENVVVQGTYALLSLMIPRDAKLLGAPNKGESNRRARRVAARSSKRRSS